MLLDMIFLKIYLTYDHKTVVTIDKYIAGLQYVSICYMF